MIRLPVAEREFTLALIVSTAIHAALLPLLLSFASGSALRHVQPIGEICINAFLVPGTLPATGKTAALPGRKLRQAVRIAPMAAAPLREIPEKVAPAEKEDMDLPADIRPSAEWSERGNDTGASPALVSPPANAPSPLPVSPPGPAVLIQGGKDSSGSIGSGISAVRRGSGEFSRENNAGGPTPRQQGSGTPQEGNGAWPPKDADAVPRYGDNALPVYPPLARLRGYQGVALLFVEVLADGRVGQVGIRRSTGHEILDRTALEAVRSWKFEPGRREGRPVTMSVAVPVRFVLKENSILVKTDDRR
jgi:TonB family protein